eukprot:4402661-Pyramimonas_sp.AAC.1
MASYPSLTGTLGTVLRSELLTFMGTCNKYRCLDCGRTRSRCSRYLLDWRPSCFAYCWKWPPATLA